jgi:hypothetical protein
LRLSSGDVALARYANEKLEFDFFEENET